MKWLPGGGSVRFADEQLDSQPPRLAATPAAPAAPAGVPQRLEVRLGFLLLGGIYCTDLLLLEEAVPASTTDVTQQQQQKQPLQAEVCGLTASNLSVVIEQRRLVLRLWAEREGPFEADFTLALTPGQQIEAHVTATVFSRKKGTPGLRPHVRCLGFSAETDTDAASDWQGF